MVLVQPPPVSISLLWHVAIAVVVPSIDRTVHAGGTRFEVSKTHWPVALRVYQSKHAERQYGNLSV